MLPAVCPVCTRWELRPVFQDVNIHVQIDSQKTVSGVLAYQCMQFGHIFFVRKSDVEVDESEISAIA